MFAPLGAAQVHLRVADLLAAGCTLADRFVLPELDLSAAMRAGDREDVLRFPIPHVLTWATSFGVHFVKPSTACRMALICAGVVPQQPPTIFAPASTTALTFDAISSGFSGKMSTPLTAFGSQIGRAHV